MASYEYLSKADLVESIHAKYVLLDAEFENIGNSQRDTRIPEVDKTPAEIIAYQLGWLQLVMGWDEAEREGREVVMPAPGYKWNQLGGLYQSFYETYAEYSISELRDLFRQAEQQWLDWVGTLTGKSFSHKASANGQAIRRTGRWPDGFTSIRLPLSQPSGQRSESGRNTAFRCKAGLAGKSIRRNRVPGLSPAESKAYAHLLPLVPPSVP